MILKCNLTFFTTLFSIIIFFVFSSRTRTVSGGTVVTSLPGYDGQLPFYFETGYIGVGESNESQLFYYFVESQKSPSLDPLMLWLTGGPGCSVLSAFFYENGPLEIDLANYNGGFPKLKLNPYTWTRSLNILYVDAPVGTGFSYSTTQENYYLNDTKSVSQTYEFLRKWLIEHPQFLRNQLFIGGDSYSGIPLPLIVQQIVDGNKIRLEPMLNLKGYILGNPVTDVFIDFNSRLPFAHSLTLISTLLYNQAKEYCGADYVNINSSNTECVQVMNIYHELVQYIYEKHVLKPSCLSAGQVLTQGRRYLGEEISHSQLRTGSTHWCMEDNYIPCIIWANDEGVRNALHVRENTIGAWVRCNSTLESSEDVYKKTVPSTVNVHRNLITQPLRTLVYSGDHDMMIPHIGTENWIRSLNMAIDEYWRAWFVDGQVAGYTERYVAGDFTMVYATVKGAGHVAPVFKMKECFFMIERFIASFPV